MENEELAEQGWDTVIKPRTGLLEVNLQEIWRYRDLLQMFIKRDIITQYKQTILGPAWFLIQPVLTTVMFFVVFNEIAGIETGTVPAPLFYLSGLLVWNYFSESLNKTSNTFITNAAIFGKVYFPRLIVPISIVTSNLVRLGIQFGLFICVYLFYVFMGELIRPNLYLLLLPLLIVMIAGLALGFGIIISSLTTKYRDLTILFTFFIQLWMYATPIIYPLQMMSPQRQWIMALNPLTAIVETFKYGAFGEGVFSWWQLGYSFVFMVVLLGAGILVFNRVQRSFMDTV